jgi:hypothetical protein
MPNEQGKPVRAAAQSTGRFDCGLLYSSAILANNDARNKVAIRLPETLFLHSPRCISLHLASRSKKLTIN